MVMPRSRSMSIESRIWSRKSRSSTAPQRWIRRSARVDLPWWMWAIMQKFRLFPKPGPPRGGRAGPSYNGRSSGGSQLHRPRLRRAAASQLQDHLHHVVLVAVGVGAVAGDEVAVEAQAGEGLHGVRLEVGDQHAGQVAQAVVVGDADEVVDQDRAETEAAVLGVQQPLDPPDQPQRAAFAPVHGGVGHDALDRES